MDELISRQDAIDALSTPHGILYPIRTIEDLPSVQSKRKKGKWIDAEQKVNITIFDEQTDDRKIETMTIEEILDAYTDEGCPEGHSDFEGNWVPISKDLPEENVPVLLGVKYRDAFKVFVTSRVDYNYWTGLGRDIKGEMRWKPLPEPWEGERDDRS